MKKYHSSSYKEFIRGSRNAWRLRRLRDSEERRYAKVGRSKSSVLGPIARSQGPAERWKMYIRYLETGKYGEDEDQS